MIAHYGHERLAEPALLTPSEIEWWMAKLPKNHFLRVYHDYATTCSQAPSASHLLHGLLLLASTCPSTLRVPAGAGGSEFATFAPLYGLLVGETAARKTSSQELAMNLLRSSDLAERIGPRVASPEALTDCLGKSPQKTIAYPEFSTFLSATSKPPGDQLRTGLTDAYDGIAYETQGRRAGTVTVTDPRVTLFAACTPSHLSDYTTQSDFDGGFLNRFLTVFIEPPTLQDGWRRANTAKAEEWLLARINTYKGAEAGMCTGFSPEADSLWAEWFRNWQRAALGMDSLTRSVTARTPLLAMRVALVTAWGDTDPNGRPALAGSTTWKLQEKHILAGMAVACMHVASCRKLLQLVPRTPARREVLHVLAAVREDWTALGQITGTSHVERRKVLQHLETLREEGLVATEAQNSSTYYRRMHGTPLMYDHSIVPQPPPPMATE